MSAGRLSDSLAPVRRLDRALLRLALSMLGHPPVSIRLWNGEPFGAPAQAAVARVKVHDPALPRAFMAAPESALADAYVEGRIDVEGDLVGLVEALFRARNQVPGWARLLSRAATWRPRRNGRQQARPNSDSHYERDADFWGLWLDEQLVYSCAYYPTPEASLEEAQLAKLELVCRKLALEPGERVADIGCGWGALALHMAEHYGVRVDAYGLTSSQLETARGKAEARGLADRVRFIQADFRDVGGPYDAVACLGMIEHVGRDQYQSLAVSLDRCLAPGGRALLQFIGHVRPMPVNPWIVANIFPGGYLPALSEILPALESREFALVDVENLRRHYVKTLGEWLARFEKAESQVAARYGERFVRTWRLYLASSIAAFRSGSCQLYQLLLARADDQGLPWTRRERAGSVAASDRVPPVV